MKKSLQQQLQSRISLRRNFIRKLEDEAALYKCAGLNYVAKRTRTSINELAQDQRLDRRLYEMTLFQHRFFACGEMF